VHRFRFSEAKFYEQNEKIQGQFDTGDIEMEGDPQMKRKWKQLHREMVEQDARWKTKQSTILTTNLKRIAMAMYSNMKGNGSSLPIILASGQGGTAEETRGLARANITPIMRDVPLAYYLMDVGEIMTFIPMELIDPVADVFR
jgi:type III secretion protein U